MKFDLSFYDLPFNIQRLFNLFESRGYEVSIVGGCVRDLIMGVEPHDYDFTTNATPDQMKQMVENLDSNIIELLPTGEKYGTMTFKFDGSFNDLGGTFGDDLYEVTTYRGDGVYSDGRRPDTVTFGTSIKDDLSRRDFTINAMAWNPKDGLIDLFGGKKDIENKIIRCVGDSNKRFQEDALRMLRALRFAARFGFEIDNLTNQAIVDNYELISNVSKERIGTEIIQIFNTNYQTPMFLHICSYIFKNDYIWFEGEESLLSKIYSCAQYLSEEEINKFAFGKEITKGVKHLVKAHNYINDNKFEIVTKPYISKGILEILITPEERLSIFEELSNYIETRIKPIIIKTILFNEPIFISDLAIDGDWIKELFPSITGENIGKILNSCKEYVWQYPERNTIKDLTTHIKSIT